MKDGKVHCEKVFNLLSTLARIREATILTLKPNRMFPRLYKIVGRVYCYIPTAYCAKFKKYLLFIALLHDTGLIMSQLEGFSYLSAN